MREPVIAQKTPIVKEMDPGTYAWCACGLSKNQPLCDGSHRKTELEPVIIKIEERRKIAWCACKHSQSKPFCDGSHKNLMKENK